MMINIGGLYNYTDHIQVYRPRVSTFVVKVVLDRVT